MGGRSGPGGAAVSAGPLNLAAYLAETRQRIEATAENLREAERATVCPLGLELLAKGRALTAASLVTHDAMAKALLELVAAARGIEASTVCTNTREAAHLRRLQAALAAFGGAA
jgi:hypothetical protein